MWSQGLQAPGYARAMGMSAVIVCGGEMRSPQSNGGELEGTRKYAMSIPEMVLSVMSYLSAHMVNSFLCLIPATESQDLRKRQRIKEED